MQAAFFDLDKTVIARASMVAFGPSFQRAGLLSRWLVARALYAQLVYLYLGADAARMARLRTAVLRVIVGWEQAHVTEIVEETLETVIEPIVYSEALELMRSHQAAGRKVFIISASPEEIVAPLARFLGADESIATRARLDDDGRYTGEVEFYAYGSGKVDAMERVARRDGIDLEASWAYSDSVTDEPMLRAVGHPVAVNPDRDLARVAKAEDWEIRRFDRPVPLDASTRRTTPTKVGVAVGTAVVLGGAVAGGVALGRKKSPR
ncbi:MAG TPA: HAD-IB family hydrolase [Acidimicrobiales bacterium]|nr:HAD-IB family hydrolase [Acidimicrobiales bacterium]